VAAVLRNDMEERGGGETGHQGHKVNDGQRRERRCNGDGWLCECNS